MSINENNSSKCVSLTLNTPWQYLSETVTRCNDHSAYSARGVNIVWTHNHWCCGRENCCLISAKKLWGQVQGCWDSCLRKYRWEICRNKGRYFNCNLHRPKSFGGSGCDEIEGKCASLIVVSCIDCHNVTGIGENGSRKCESSCRIYIGECPSQRTEWECRCEIGKPS